MKKKSLRGLYELQSLRGVCVINEAWNPQFNKITPKTVNCSLLNKHEPKCKECSKSLIVNKTFPRYAIKTKLFIQGNSN